MIFDRLAVLNGSRVFVKSLPCAACGEEGFTEQAHVAPASEKGTGYKAGYIWIVPLCGERWNECGDFEIGCHCLYDEHRWQFDIEHPDFNPETAAQQTENLWLEHSKEKA